MADNYFFPTDLFRALPRSSGSSFKQFEKKKLHLPARKRTLNNALFHFKLVAPTLPIHRTVGKK